MIVFLVLFIFYVPVFFLFLLFMGFAKLLENILDQNFFSNIAKGEVVYSIDIDIQFESLRSVPTKYCITNHSLRPIHLHKNFFCYRSLALLPLHRSETREKRNDSIWEWELVKLMRMVSIYGYQWRSSVKVLVEVCVIFQSFHSGIASKSVAIKLHVLFK